MNITVSIHGTGTGNAIHAPMNSITYGNIALGNGNRVLKGNRKRHIRPGIIKLTVRTDTILIRRNAGSIRAYRIPSIEILVFCITGVGNQFETLAVRKNLRTLLITVSAFIPEQIRVAGIIRNARILGCTIRDKMKLHSRRNHGHVGGVLMRNNNIYGEAVCREFEAFAFDGGGHGLDSA